MQTRGSDSSFSNSRVRSSILIRRLASDKTNAAEMLQTYNELHRRAKLATGSTSLSSLEAKELVRVCIGMWESHSMPKYKVVAILRALRNHRDKYTPGIAVYIEEQCVRLCGATQAKGKLGNVQLQAPEAPQQQQQQQRSSLSPPLLLSSSSSSSSSSSLTDEYSSYPSSASVSSSAALATPPTSLTIRIRRNAVKRATVDSGKSGESKRMRLSLPRAAKTANQSNSAIVSDADNGNGNDGDGSGRADSDQSIAPPEKVHKRQAICFNCTDSDESRDDDNDDDDDDDDDFPVAKDRAVASAKSPSAMTVILEDGPVRDLTAPDEEDSFCFPSQSPDGSNDNDKKNASANLATQLQMATQQVARLEKLLEHERRRTEAFERAATSANAEIGRVERELHDKTDQTAALQLSLERAEMQVAEAEQALEASLQKPANPHHEQPQRQRQQCGRCSIPQLDTIDDANAVLYEFDGWTADAWHSGYTKASAMPTTTLHRASKSVFDYGDKYNLEAKRRYHMFSHATYPYASWDVVRAPLMPNTPPINDRLLRENPNFSLVCCGGFFVSDELYALATMPDDIMDAENRRCLRIRLIPSKDGEPCSRSPSRVCYSLNQRRVQVLREEEDYTYNSLFGYDITHKISRGWNVLTVHLAKPFGLGMCFSVRLVEFFSFAQVLQKFNARHQPSMEACRMRFWREFHRARELAVPSRRRDNDAGGDADNVQAPEQQFRYSVLDAHSALPIRRPVRFRDCQHVECFDFETFLEINTANPKMACPYCPSRGPVDNLVKDAFFGDIARLCTARGATEFHIVQEPDLRWAVSISRGNASPGASDGSSDGQ